MGGGVCSGVAEGGWRCCEVRPSLLPRFFFFHPPPTPNPSPFPTFLLPTVGSRLNLDFASATTWTPLASLLFFAYLCSSLLLSLCCVFLSSLSIVGSFIDTSVSVSFINLRIRTYRRYNFQLDSILFPYSLHPIHHIKHCFRHCSSFLVPASRDTCLHSFFFFPFSSAYAA